MSISTAVTPVGAIHIVDVVIVTITVAVAVLVAEVEAAGLADPTVAEKAAPGHMPPSNKADISPVLKTP
jgi:hypothetical protein